MSKRLKKLLLSTTGLALCVVSASPRSVHAQEVFVDRDAEACTSGLTEAIFEELTIRTEAELSDVAEAQVEDDWELTLRPLNAGRCELLLGDGDRVHRFTLDVEADRLEIASVATRMAWIIDGKPAEEPTEKPAIDPVAIQPERSPEGSSVDVSTGTSTSPNTQPDDSRGRPVVGLDASGGALWLPAPNAAISLVRTGAKFRPWRTLQFALLGRLPLNSATTNTGGTQLSYRPWSVDLTAAWIPRLSRAWTLTMGAGARRTFAQLNIRESSTGMAGEVLQQTPARVTGDSDSPVDAALSPWAVVGTAGISHALARMVAIRFDATAAVALANRRIRDDQRVLMNLGRVEMDATLGLEVRF